MEQYPAPLGNQQFECEFKRSRFITGISYVEHKAQAKTVIAVVRQRYPDANHHCWAMVAGAPDDQYQQDQNHDGEPKGTAGKPMLNVLQHSGLGNVVVVVTRYFGGIKLGAGGLVRAYTRSVSEPLKEIKTQLIIRKDTILVKLPYEALATFEHWLQSTGIDVSEKAFTDAVVLTLQVPKTDLGALNEKLQINGGTQLKNSCRNLQSH